MNIFKRETKLRDPTPQEIMKYLGLPPINFNNVDEDGKPPSYMPEDPEERKNFVADLEVIYQNQRLKKVFEYIINLLGNHSFQVAEEGNMRNGRYAMLGVKALWSELENAHLEHKANTEKKEPIDKHAILED